ncbi:Ldh family oxidoreductase [Diaphorobacter aerolatus]|uniref:Delta(1)-pyrroline-2-carboxylate/Delta(1)-piperideine-2-carboxylate reductase n=1 Tax=Diaphorobacter aerolatus TaxID=1288495 RepID=A0A7H0GMG5_9BURK|nr:Ldh family oxidoreductase [Diaphorobacter aerolatus]QNP49481.1 Ldh family oxidoreductase [Diaphorobacter aerolatus]
MTTPTLGPTDQVLIPFDEMRAVLCQIFERHGTSAEVAAALADNCAAAQRDGAMSHGLFRIPGYVSTLKSGWVDGKAVPVVEDKAPGFLSVDAANGYAQPAYRAAYEAFVRKVRANGIALLAIRRSHHFAALWPDVEPLAREGLVALTMVNSMACVVPSGGNKALFGTNPIAFAAPRENGDPLVFDLATSATAHGDIQIAARAGHEVPIGYGVDRHGEPTTKPKEILEGGALLPFGGEHGAHKGSALAMMVELLAAALTGGNFSFEFDWSQHPGAQSPYTGQLIIAIDPSLTSGQNFAQRCETLVQAMADAGQQRQPGDRRYEQRARSMAHGVPVDAAQWQQLLELAGPAHA